MVAMKRYYNPKNGALLYFGHSAESDYWDSHWEHYLRKLRVDRFVQIETRKYLPLDSCVLEGGCGFGEKVYSLKIAGYRAIGIDFAQKTVAKINSKYPDLNIKWGDVRNLPIESGIVDGYWSLGVIEHFWDGYDQISSEMYRVLRPGGYLFLTFPVMSPIRKYKASKKQYLIFNKDNVDESGFYQFALEPDSVRKHFEEKGFVLKKSKYMDGLKGLKDEMLPHPWLQALYDSSNFFARAVRKIINFVLSPFMGHVIYFVFQKPFVAEKNEDRTPLQSS